MATVTKDFRVKAGLVVEGSTATVAGKNVITAGTVDAKGDLIVGSADDAVARLGIGSNGQVLTANSGATYGVEWSAPAAVGVFGSSIEFEGATANDFETTLAVTDPTADRTITLPDATGTVALTSDITVSADSTNTFSNKSISLGSNTVTGSVAEFNAALKDYDFVTTADTGTVTSTMIANDTIVDADINSAAAIAQSKISGLTTDLGNKASASDLTTHTGATEAHGATGAVVGTTNTQTLTNKTLTSPKINEDVALTATATELNVLDGITSTTAELNLLDGVTATTTELNYVDGVTSGIQTQLDGKVDESLFDTKGDILVASADNTPAKLAAGTNGYLLTANSAATNGIEWAAAPISLPSQTNNSGKYLITDGSSASWSTLPINIITQVTIDSSSSSAVLDTLPALSFVSAEYIVSITQYDNSTEDTKVRTSRVLIQTDGVSVDLTEYGIVETNGLISGVAISADVTQDILTLTDNVRLLANISDATVNVARARIVRTLVTPWVDTVPDAPISVSGTSGNGQSVVSFTAPVDNGGDPVDDYTVTASPGGATATGASSPITVTGLTNGTSYTFTVVATNGVGSSQASQASSSVTPSTVPDSPTIDSATAGNTEIAVAFSAPASNGGAAITGYTAKATPAVGSTITATGTSSPITITGLTNGTAYNVALFATNIKGNSTDATHGSSVTPILPITLTGGTITNAGGYRYHTFTSTDNLILSNGNKTVDILCIAGGGGGANGGGAVNGGGGGAGGLQLFSNQTLTPGTYLATVGSGGTGGAQSFQRGSNGTNSQFGSLTASVGGGGGGRDSYTGGGAQSAQNGIAGGSGGGGGGYYTNSSGGAGTSGQGFAGGSGVSGGAAGGGGGSAAVGSRPDAGAGSDYSAWATATTTGSSGFYAGGGGGGVTSGTAGQGAAGGGVGGSGSSAGVNATANTGSGGGGGSRNGSNSGSGNGSNGLVIVRYVA